MSVQPFLMRIIRVVVVVVTLAPVFVHAQVSYSLKEAIAVALENDPWLAGSRFRQEAMVAESVAAGQLPDPVLSVGLANMPVDSLDFGREPMTQFQVGLAQTFPRGESRPLKQQQLAELSAKQIYLRQDRRAKVAMTVAQLWLDAYRYGETIRLIRQDRPLFEQLVEISQARYTTTAGRVRQQDLVRAQLELTQLDDRLTKLEEARHVAKGQLSEWLPGTEPGVFSVAGEMPVLALAYPVSDGETALAHLLEHPAIESLEQDIVASATGVDLARQSYKPEWGVRAGYGYRDEDPTGQDRSDFFSVSLTLDMPLFTAKRQDKEVKAAIARTGAAKTEKQLMLRNLRSGLETGQARLQRLDERRDLYQQRLLRQTVEQTEAALAAYTNDMGDFAEVVRSRIAELNAKIDFLTLRVDRLKTIAQLNYFLATTENADSTGIAP